jgi:hypothetical protein
MTKALGEPRREELEVIAANDLFFIAETEPLEKATARAHQAKLIVLREKRDLGEEVEEPIKRRIRADAAEKTGADRGGTILRRAYRRQRGDW